MEKPNKHIENNRDKDQIKSFPEIEMNWSKSKEEVWSQLASQISEPTQARGRVINLYWKISVAAVLVVMLATSSFLFLYKETVSASSGEHLTAILPDGSSVELNASSVIEYKPFWWYFDRTVHFEGEGFFKVQKGKRFRVLSSYGETIVLGTSFNIYSRKGEYKVTCFTGKVKVVSVVSGNSVKIVSNEQVVIENDGDLILQKEVNGEETISWMNDMFIFTRTPIKLVFEEIERQYGITISTKEKLNYLYSGNFTRDRSVEEVLKMVCLPLGLTFEKINGEYLVQK